MTADILFAICIASIGGIAIGWLPGKVSNYVFGALLILALILSII